MATGDTPDILKRLRSYLPNGWFPDTDTVLDGVLTGIATVLSFIWSFIGYAKLQTRIKTATDGWLDIVAYDFLGTRLQRNPGEADAPFSARIIREILRPRATRAALSQAVEDLTGKPPFIFEPARPADTGGYNVGGVGYNVAGGYGSLMLRNQVFVTVARPATSGIPFVAGYNAVSNDAGLPLGGYGIGAIQYSTLDMIQGIVTDAEIYATIDSVMPAGEIAWVNIGGEIPDLVSWWESAFGDSGLTIMSLTHHAVHVVAPSDLGV
jgi:hypothetical protein